MNVRDPAPAYGALVWRDFRRSKLAMLGLATIALVLFVAVLCPFIANGRPLYIRAVFQDDFDNSLGILHEQIVDLSDGGSDRNVILAERSFDEIAPHLNATDRKHADELRELFRSNVDSDELPEKTAATLLTGVDALYNAPLEPTVRFAALRALGGGERYILCAFAAFCVAIGFRRRLGWIGVLLAALAAGLLAMWIWNFAFPVIADKRPYRAMAEAPGFAENGGSVVWPLVPYGENENVIAEARQAPTWALGAEDKIEGQHWHWLGTDTNGRDVLARMVYGSRVSMVIGIVAVAIYTAIGILLGALAGYFGGWIDIAISRVIEIVICFPPLLLILAVQAFLIPSVFNIILALAALWWTTVARLQRAEFLRLVNMDYVQSIRALGGSHMRIIFRHILPNGLGPILVLVSFGIAGSILIESGLSFLGFGVPQPMASWGDLLNNGRNDPRGLWWLTIFPGLAIFLTVTSFNLIGEGLRDALDPMRER